ncbi:putative toxin-antitoxin system toxin component, PIN family [Runella salmonicolor]|uniref:Toxin-antitoxin system toxin component, PIN family n=1 Tax=Runella salmonicolor TaxID=2950278 RepID=A0ABT1FKM2_9BACT|nr:putative toxin-antitoxin system toxin component, PIN family [Runella salmonicolor]MCP1381062.1 putative toxin-antitoxin system toxin component, PIN family [Runella salmonicolor]
MFDEYCIGYQCFTCCFAFHSKYYPIYQALLNKRFDLYVSNEILTEYEEQISQRLGIERTNLQLRELLNLSNVYCIEPFYNWQLIEIDPDDNKFCDCAVAFGADYLVTNDHHYDILTSIPFPPIETLRAENFLQMLF